MLRVPRAVTLAVLVLASVPLLADEAAPAASASPKETNRLSEDLIYSVDRTPERTFETSRAVEVINADTIRRSNAAGLADLLEEHAGLVVESQHSGGTPIMRGLSGKQVMLLVDGVKVNNASYGSETREYLNLISLDQVERIEVVRGVVSVLGTESLGGVINIITKKGPGATGESFGGAIRTRYATSDSSVSVPIEVFGRSDQFRYDAGFAAGSYGEQRAGDVGKQANTSYRQRSAYLNGQWLLSPEKTIGFGYQDVDQRDVQQPGVPGLFNALNFLPRTMQLGNVSYQDLTSRGWEDSLRISAYWNRQEQHESADLSPRPPLVFNDSDVMTGLNVELGTFAGAHHLLYGIDSSTDHVDSTSYSFSTTTGELLPRRGNVTDGAHYRTLGVYLQDHFDPAKWLTVIAGARWGQFKSKGSEVLDIGPIDLSSSKSDVTGALNLIFHVSPKLNVIANGFRGFRAPNIYDSSKYNFIRTANGVGFEVPAPNVQPERVISYEGGLKYDDGNLGGSAFYFRNRLTDLLVLAPGLLNGLPWRDTNGDGIRQASEFAVFQNQNVGSATIHGVELDGHYSLSNGVTAWGHYTKTKGTDTRTDSPLSMMPPSFGAAGVRYLSAATYQPWVEVVWRYYGKQDQLSLTDRANPDVVNGSIPGFNVFHVRTGLALTSRVTITAALQNITDKKYREAGSGLFAPGRGLVLGTELRF